jgi:hypothetical protein
MRFRRVALILTFVCASASLAAAQTGTNGRLPPDVDPASRNRLSLLKPGAEGVDAIRMHGSGVDVRWQSPLGRALTELAILASAREHDQPYEWSLHEMEALAVGLEPAVIDVVRHRKPVTGIADKPSIIIEIGREVFGRHTLRSDTYARALGILGKTNLVDVVSLMGAYAGTATRLTAVNQQMPAGWKQFLPLPFTPPDDIHPDSKSRLAYLKGDPAMPGPLYSRGLAPEGTGPGHIRRHGSGGKMLEAGVGKAMMSLAVLVSSRAHHQQYHWTTNELTARQAGLDAAVIDVVRHGRPLNGLAEKEAALIQFARELFEKHTVSPSTYAAALKLFGERNLIDLVDLMARHVTDVALLTAFDQHLPPGQKPLLPE